jgi:hypothetical protein
MDRYKFHRRCVGPAYSASSVKHYEGRVLEAVDRICNRLRRFNGAELITADWVHVMVLGKLWTLYFLPCVMFLNLI